MKEIKLGIFYMAGQHSGMIIIVLIQFFLFFDLFETFGLDGIKFAFENVSNSLFIWNYFSNSISTECY